MVRKEAVFKMEPFPAGFSRHSCLRAGSLMSGGSVPHLGYLQPKKKKPTKTSFEICVAMTELGEMNSLALNWRICVPWHCFLLDAFDEAGPGWVTT